MNVIGTFWRETTWELIHIVWLVKVNKETEIGLFIRAMKLFLKNKIEFKGK